MTIIPTNWLTWFRRKPAPRCVDCRFYGLKYKLTPACYRLQAQPTHDGVRHISHGVPLSRIDSPRAVGGCCGPRGKLFQPKETK